jgi:hypothetical protein
MNVLGQVGLSEMDLLRASEAVATDARYSPPWRPGANQLVTAEAAIPFTQMLRPIETRILNISLRSQLQHLGTVNFPIPYMMPYPIEELIALSEQGVKVEDFRHAVDHIFKLNSTNNDLN